MDVSNAAARFQSMQFRSEPEQRSEDAPREQTNGKANKGRPGQNRPRRRGKPLNDNGTTTGGDSRSTIPTAPSSESTSTDKPDEPAEPEDICIICASEVVYYAVPPCNHRSCHICSLRLRSLYQTKACPQCRVPAAETIFTSDSEKRFEDFSASEITNNDVSLGIKFTGKDIYIQTTNILDTRCPDTNCTYTAPGWDELKQHVSRSHQRTFCDICVGTKKVFAHEHEIFSKKGLLLHERYGENARSLKPTVKSGFSGHPECGFCKTRYYGDDELFAHCRDQHERCYICDRASTDGRYQYYLNYDKLEGHFRDKHFPCLEQECLDKKFVVFETEMDLQAHELEAHPGLRPAPVRPSRDVRRVNLSSFVDLRPAYVPENSRRGQNNDSRGQTNGNRVVHAPSIGGVRTFGGQLTSRPAAASGSGSASGPASAAAPDRTRLIAAVMTDSVEPDSPADRARRTRHEAVLNRVRQLARSDESAVPSFRDLISQFRRSAITADHLVVRLLGLFPEPPSEIGILIRELADIFEIADRRDSLLRAWNDWRAINENFPALGAANGSGDGASTPSRLDWNGPIRRPTPSSLSTSMNGRGLGVEQFPSLLSSTAATRQKGKVTSSWSTATMATPATTRASRASAPTQSAQVPTSAASHSTSSTSGRVSSTTNSSAPNRPAPSADSFPALPVAKKPVAAAFSRGYGGNAVLSHSEYMALAGNGKPTANAWSSSSSAAAAAAAPSDGDSGAGKKGAKKKQTLIRFG